MPPLHRPVMSTIGFHIRAGRHDVTSYDWDQYMNFADRHMTGSPPVAGDIGRVDSHPEAMRGEFADFDFQAANISDGSNSGMIFRKGFGPLGAKPNAWFTQEAIAQGNHIAIQVDGKVTVEYVEYIDDKNTYTKAILPRKQHHPGSIVKFRNPRMKPLP
jgi:hypothetical protein